MQDWEALNDTEDVNIMTNKYLAILSQTLDRHAPKRTIKIHKKHVTDISAETKDLMRKRNRAGDECVEGGAGLTGQAGHVSDGVTNLLAVCPALRLVHSAALALHYRGALEWSGKTLRN